MRDVTYGGEMCCKSLGCSGLREYSVVFFAGRGRGEPTVLVYDMCGKCLEGILETIKPDVVIRKKRVEGVK